MSHINSILFNFTTTKMGCGCLKTK